MPLFHRPLPEPLAVLHELALDLHWSWNHACDQLWQRINPEVWEHTQNPITVLHLTSDQQLQALSEDADFLEQLQQLTDARHRYLNQPSWFQRHYSDSGIEGIAYFSMEFGLCDALPLYAGGLGMLAGDYLKTASDLGVPITGIGLLYQEGYFHQSLDRDGWQQETYLFNDPGSLPLKPLRAEDGSWLHIDTEFLGRKVRFRVWEAHLGRVTLYLLDSNDPRNRAVDRGITSKLYGGGTELRLVQEIALGICGWRLIETLGLEHYLCHLNEGHAAFATLERIRAYRQQHSCDFDQALWATRGGNIFTTHTPVAAGFDRYPPERLAGFVAEFSPQLGLSVDQLMALGRAQPTDNEEWFNMAYLAMRTCAFTNGVSALHGQVSRQIFQPLFPRWPEREVPVGHVTNGVHVPTWDSIEADEQWTRLFGQERWRADLAEVTPEPILAQEDQSLWQVACQNRAELVDYARTRQAQQRRRESEPHPGATDGDSPLDPNLLTVGFARRFAEYKRPTLLLQNPERLARLLNHAQHPIQLIIAGKAHPADKTGQGFLQQWHQFIQRSDVQHRVVFLEDYDIELAQHLVQGVDLWLNTPRRPWEASGTSGMKVLVNGGLNLSSLDGWWAEAYAPELGWALGDGEEHGPEQDADDAEQLYRLFEEDIAPLFYQRDANDRPQAWLAMMRASMAQLTGAFSCNRMIIDYIERYYRPANRAWSERQNEPEQLVQWHRELKHHWHEVHLGALASDASKSGMVFNLVVQLGRLAPDSVRIQVVADPDGEEPAITLDLTPSDSLEAAAHSYRYSATLNTQRPAEHFTARVIPQHPSVQIPAECPLITWAR